MTTTRDKVLSVRLPDVGGNPLTLAFAEDDLLAVDEAAIMAGSPSRSAWIQDVTQRAAGPRSRPDAAAQSGLTLPAWVRLVCLVAAGRSSLAKQLARVRR